MLEKDAGIDGSNYNIYQNHNEKSVESMINEDNEAFAPIL